jgi:FkbM family methyltransferase
MSPVLPWRLAQAARATRRALAGAPVPDGWVGDAVKTQLRLAAGRVQQDNGLVRVPVGGFDVAGFSVSSLAHLHREIFVELAYYFEAGRADPFIVDGGSNIGMSVLFFKALYPDAHVLSFEPAARAHGVLVRNIEANSLSGVDVHRAALGGQAGDVPFFEDPDDPATFRMSTRPERIPGTATSVSQRRLSEFLTRKVDLLKLDVEGAEDAVLSELIESQAIALVDQLIVEYHHHLDPLDPFRDSVDRFLGCLRQQGFTYRVSAAERVNERRGTAASSQDVLVFARRSPVEKISDPREEPVDLEQSAGSRVGEAGFEPE